MDSGIFPGGDGEYYPEPQPIPLKAPNYYHGSLYDMVVLPFLGFLRGLKVHCGHISNSFSTVGYAWA